MRRWWVTFRRENVLNLVQRIVTSGNLGVCILVPKRKQDHQHPVQIASGERHKPIESLSGIFGSPRKLARKISHMLILHAQFREHGICHELHSRPFLNQG